MFCVYNCHKNLDPALPNWKELLEKEKKNEECYHNEWNQKDTDCLKNIIEKDVTNWRSGKIGVRSQLSSNIQTFENNKKNTQIHLSNGLPNPQVFAQIDAKIEQM